MYLGSQRVCPAVLVGGGSDPTEYVTLKLPDDKITFDLKCGFSSIPIYDSNDDYVPVCLDFNKTETLGNEAFTGCFYSQERVVLKNIDSLKHLGEKCFFSAFNYATFEDGYRDIVFNNVERVDNSAFAMFGDGSNISSIRFKKNVSFYGRPFSMCAEGVNNFSYYFDGVTQSSFTDLNNLASCCFDSSGRTLHFPSNLSSFIPTLTGYPNFGGTNVTILYDLEPTE